MSLSNKTFTFALALGLHQFIVFQIYYLYLPQLTPSASANIAEFGLATTPKQSAIGSPLLVSLIGFFSYSVVAIPYAFSWGLNQSVIPAIVMFDVVEPENVVFTL